MGIQGLGIVGAWIDETTVIRDVTKPEPVWVMQNKKWYLNTQGGTISRAVKPLWERFNTSE